MDRCNPCHPRFYGCNVGWDGPLDDVFQWYYVVPAFKSSTSVVDHTSVQVVFF